MLRNLPVGLLAAVLVTAPACATQGALYPYPVGARSVDQRAYAAGYSEGRQRGEQDAYRRRSFDYGRHGAYRDADAGYRGYGDRSSYRAVFRQGFVAGYDDGYRRFARVGLGTYPQDSYGSAGILTRSPAARIGYQDGFAQGREDARGGDRFDPVRAKRYRAGDHDYDRPYGSRDDYKREYRAAFQAGYRQGYGGRRPY